MACCDAIGCVAVGTVGGVGGGGSVGGDVVVVGSGGDVGSVVDGGSVAVVVVVVVGGGGVAGASFSVDVVDIDFDSGVGISACFDLTLAFKVEAVVVGSGAFRKDVVVAVASKEDMATP